MNIASGFVRNVIDRARGTNSTPNTLSSTPSTSDTEERIAAIVAQDPGILTVELAQILGISDPGVLIGFAENADAEVTPDGRWYLCRNINLDDVTMVLL
ncbi:hypothetical protein [Prescottella agglutinans]|jgi:hypothetical protein|uniref:Uncharacterized protein n=1 Tax=Prescottella agglutinans TaxID=1644129 RepID=A0ABT6MHZ4_9NOCA|nr:hypothetical protein [Prescottella agglutinans]MDH6283948.1 hypothetical protein [Prescottella agglutinans]